MVQGVERLMPWRTMIEVAKNMIAQGHEPIILSGQEPEDIRTYDGVKIHSINHGIVPLKEFLRSGNWDIIYYPFTYRDGLKNQNSWVDINIKKVAYIPSGICPLSGSLSLLKMGYGRLALPYLLDSLIPHRFLANKLQKNGFETLVCQSPMTSKDAIKSGWKNVRCAIPGKENNHVIIDESVLIALGCQDQKFILFSGAPSATRGAILAMKAFDNIANKVLDTKMVMLMRRDVSSDFSDFDKAVEKLVHKDRFIISYEKVSQGQLFAFLKKSWAVILPFLIIPSEIPLTFFEVMEFGTPVITFENGGTTDYLRVGLMIAQKRTVSSLASAVYEICNNPQVRYTLAAKSKDIMSSHPTWAECSMEWMRAL